MYCDTVGVRSEVAVLRDRTTTDNSIYRGDEIEAVDVWGLIGARVLFYSEGNHA